MAAGDWAVAICSPCFDLAPELVRRLEAGSVNACGLTQRAAEVWESARFLSMFLAFGFFRFDGESTLPPQAGNASRWAAG